MVHFTADFICARCLEIFPRELSNTIRLVYVKGKDPFQKTEQVKLQSTDIDKIYYIGSQLDLSIGIREAIVLSIPIASICKSTCRGLCPVCGKNRNKYSCKCTTEKVGSFTVTPSLKDPRRKPSRKK